MNDSLKNFFVNFLNFKLKIFHAINGILNLHVILPINEKINGFTLISEKIWTDECTAQ